MLITLFIGDLDMKKIMTGTAENHVAFSRRIAAVFPTLDARYEMIERAYNTAKDSFRGVMRDGGERYFEHLREVTLILTDHLRVRDHRLIVAALLHDMVEDVPFWSVERIEREFRRDIAVRDEWVTKPPQGSFPDKDARDHAYHARLLEAPRDVAIFKLADRLHNVRTLWSCSPEKRQRKIEETRRWYLPLAEKHIILIHELETALVALETEAM